MAAQHIPLRTRLLCGTALLLVSTSASLAQDDDNEVISLDPIEVRKQDPLGDAADRATAVYVSDAELERSRMGDLKDLFAGIASVSVGGAIPVAQKIYVNGVDMLNLAIQVDGVSQNNRVFHHVSANAFDPGLMKFVRVDPGVAPADAGPQALAGRVVMETIDAEDFLAEGQAVGGKAHISYADNGSTGGVSLTLAGRSQGFEIIAYGRWMSGDNYTDGGGNEVTGTAADLTSGLLKLAYESTEGHRLEFSTQQMDDASDRNFRANFGPGRGTVFYDTTRRVTSFRYENTNDYGMWDPEFVVGFSESDIKAPLYGPSNGISNTYSAKFQNTFHLSDVNTIVAGIDYQDKTSKYTEAGLAPEAQEKSQIVGVFAQARFEPTDRLRISTGLRADWQDFTGQDFSQSGTPYTDDPFGLSGNLSLSYDVTDELTLRAGYSSIFGGIGLEDNYLFYEIWDYSALQSSRAENIILGADWTRGALTLGAEFFRTEINDARTFTGPYLGRSVTNYDFETQGFNLGATYGWDGGFARLTYTNTDVKVDGVPAGSYEALDLGTPVGQLVALQVQQSLPQYNLLVGGSLDFAMEYDTGSAGSTQKLEAYQVVNLFAEYSPPSLNGVTFRGSVQNLFDQEYADRATYAGDYASTPSLNEPGRTLVIEAIARF